MTEIPRGWQPLPPREELTPEAKRACHMAEAEANSSRHSYIGTEHLLLALLRDPDAASAKILGHLGVEIGRVRQVIESVLGRNERIIIQQIIPTSRVRAVIGIAFTEAKRTRDRIGTEHLLLALLIEGDGIAAHVLNDLGANLERVREALGAAA